MEKITLDMARKMIEASIKFAEEKRVMPGSFAVVDEGGHLIAAERRDGGLAGTLDIAIDKAWTAASMKASGMELEMKSEGKPMLWMIKHKGRITIIPGAVPIMKGDEVIGGIGHSGGSAMEDEDIAQAGAGIWKK